MLTPRTNVVLLFLGCNMAMILLFTSSAFTNWISSQFSFATSQTFNPYLVGECFRSIASQLTD
jgi:chitin synthase